MDQIEQTLIRRHDWAERLAEAVEAAKGKPYAIGEHDCLRFACGCIEAMTGVDYWPAFAGYRTRRQALKTIARYGSSMEAAAARVLGVSSLPCELARRGDVLIYCDEQGEHLGVCVGARVALLTDDGLGFLGLHAPGMRCSFRIG
jgi:hypothetical protein